MAIGSAPEIGTKFAGVTGWLEGRAAVWRQEVGGNLLGGFATLNYVPQALRDKINRERESDAAQGPWITEEDS